MDDESGESMEPILNPFPFHVHHLHRNIALCVPPPAHCTGPQHATKAQQQMRVVPRFQRT